MREESERALRERIEETRVRMGDTVEEIGARVNPDRLQRELKARARDEVDDLRASMKRKARSTMRDLEHEVEDRGRSVWQTIKDNPIPSAMVGVGLAWLAANGRSDADEYPRESRRRYLEPYPTRAPAYGYEALEYDVSREYAGDVRRGDERDRSTTYRARETASGVADQARERVGDAAETTRQAASDAAEKTRERARDAAETTRETASDLADRTVRGLETARDRADEWTDRVEYRTRRAGRRVEEQVADNPLAAGAMAAAIGFAAGLMVPETRRENELLGPARDRAIERAKDRAEEAMGQAREKAREKAGQAAREAVDRTLPGGDAEERAARDPGRTG